MKKLALILCFMSTASIAETGDGQASAKIVPSLTIVQLQELDFGALSCTGRYYEGVCGLIMFYNRSYDPGPAYYGNITQLGAPYLPVIKVTGEYNASLSLGVGPKYIYLKKAGGQDMEVRIYLRSTLASLSANEGNGLGSYIVDINYVSCIINENQAPGTYTASYNVIVNYI